MSKIQFSPRLWAAAGVTAVASVATGSAVAAMMDATVSSLYTSVSLPISGLGSGETGSTSTSASVSISQFDASLGTLTGISLTFNDGWESGATATVPLASCQGEAGLSGSCSYALSAAFTATGVMTTPEGTGTASQTLIGSDTTSQPGASGTGSASFGVYTPSSTTGLGLPAGFGTDLTPYLGLGTWDLLFDINVDGVLASSQCSTISGDPYCPDPNPQAGTLNGDANWYINNIAVTYTYDPAAQVPEPSSLALFSVAIAVLGAAAGLRRRQY